MTGDQKALVKQFIFSTALRILTRSKKRTLDELRKAMPFHLLFFGMRGLWRLQRKEAL
jgi:hypothetical protein